MSVVLLSLHFLVQYSIDIVVYWQYTFSFVLVVLTYTL